MATLGPIITNTKTGAKGTASDFVANFERLWAQPARHVDEFLDALSPDVRLVAPLGVVTVGREAGLRSLRRTFAALPDMRGEVDRWAETNDAILIEMRFIATIGDTGSNGPTSTASASKAASPSNASPTSTPPQSRRRLLAT